MALILGIHMGHDAGVCVVEDGRILSHLERERHTRVKHAAITEAADIDLALKDAGRDIDDVDFIAVTCTQNWPLIFADHDAFNFKMDMDVPAALLKDPGIAQTFGGALRTQDAMTERATARASSYMSGGSNAALFTKKYDLNDPNVSVRFNGEFLRSPRLWTQETSLAQLRADPPKAVFDMFRSDHSTYHWPIKANIRGRSIPGVVIAHHMAHAANAFYQSDLEHAAIMTYDGSVKRGEFGIGQGFFLWGEGKRIFPIIPNWLSSGNIYMRVAAQISLGGELGGPGKLMGLAPYGKPRFFDSKFVGNIFDNPKFMDSDNDPDNHEKNKTYFQFAMSFIQNANSLAVDLGYKDLREQIKNPLNDFCKDLAASTQKLFEEQTLIAAVTLFDLVQGAGKPTNNICLAGGCALNCPSNSRLWREGPFQNVFVPPTADDSGLAIGAALLLAHGILDLPRQPQGAGTSTSAYLGRRHDQADIARALERAEGIVVSDVGDAAIHAAKALAAGEIVAWHEGRSEVGPRALGHRSILADPRVGEHWQRVNRIKRREEWRPFAPAVLEEDAADWFDGIPLPSPFMLFTAQVRSKQLPAITHVDGSARIQTVNKDCGEFRRVIEGFKAETGIPIVMNTSFNGPGEPIIETTEEAIAFLKTSELDAVYIGGKRVERAG
jgi:carbamoyltransferase